jgi:hypothetical protein
MVATIYSPRRCVGAEMWRIVVDIIAHAVARETRYNHANFPTRSCHRLNGRYAY